MKKSGTEPQRERMTHLYLTDKRHTDDIRRPLPDPKIHQRSGQNKHGHVGTYRP